MAPFPIVGTALSLAIGALGIWLTWTGARILREGISRGVLRAVRLQLLGLKAALSLQRASPRAYLIGYGISGLLIGLGGFAICLLSPGYGKVFALAFLGVTIYAGLALGFAKDARSVLERLGKEGEEEFLLDYLRGKRRSVGIYFLVTGLLALMASLAIALGAWL